INDYFLENYARISGRHETPSLRLLSDLSEDPLADLKSSREKDRILQRTTRGIHKDELEFLIDDMPVKKIASQGQLKSYILSVRLAQYAWLREKTGGRPILLLDDIFDKLDQSRVNALIDILSGDAFGQVFLSDTSITRLPDIFAQGDMEWRLFEIDEGQIKST
ncbi:MAG: DNA replication and repair protein RecF, partial [Saprospiraceae bacterium]|nr:DNA replication and repair protein RecF [Saprospiraceae bacterium]